MTSNIVYREVLKNFKSINKSLLIKDIVDHVCACAWCVCVVCVCGVCVVCVCVVCVCVCGVCVCVCMYVLLARATVPAFGL